MFTLLADYTCVNGRLIPDVRVTVDDAGRIAAVTQAASGVAAPPAAAGGEETRLSGCALLPGFVNVHSHAFQRALRGAGETYMSGVGDFWSWREAMYALVESVDRATFKRICRQAFDEMLRSGITTVGEFHYLHHEDPVRADYAFDELVLEAAAESGIRLVLLACYYRTGAIGQPLAGGQRRFDGVGLDAFLSHVDGLGPRLDRRTQTLGLAPHSIRAVPPADLKRIYRAGLDRGMVVHMHVEEQAKEIAECRRVLGTAPLQWLLDNLDLGPAFTAVHMTQSGEFPVDRYVASGARLCACPITEGNLGDGIGEIGRMLSRRSDSVCIGSDSNIRIDMVEELRWLEFAQRLKVQKRGVCVGDDISVGRQLLRCGSANGAAALGVAAGLIEVGRWADFFTVDLRHAALADVRPECLLDAFLMGCGADAIRGVWVGGERMTNSEERMAKEYRITNG